MSIKEREELLFQKLREKDPDIVADGVICEQEFLNARSGQQLIIMTLSRSRLICIKQTLLFAVARSMLLWMHVIRTERLNGK